MKPDARRGHDDWHAKIPVHILLDPEDDAAIERLIAQTGESKSGFVRRLIRTYLQARASRTGIPSAGSGSDR
jgi:hypothetical protein